MKNLLLIITSILFLAFAQSCGQTEAKNVSTASISSVKEDKKPKCPCENSKIEIGAKGGRYCMVVSKKTNKPYKRYLAAEQCL
jgi:hypothetical protein